MTGFNPYPPAMGGGPDLYSYADHNPSERDKLEEELRKRMQFQQMIRDISITTGHGQQAPGHPSSVGKFPSGPPAAPQPLSPLEQQMRGAMAEQQYKQDTEIQPLGFAGMSEEEKAKAVADVQNDQRFKNLQTKIKNPNAYTTFGPPSPEVAASVDNLLNSPSKRHSLAPGGKQASRFLALEQIQKAKDAEERAKMDAYAEQMQAYNSTNPVQLAKQQARDEKRAAYAAGKPQLERARYEELRGKFRTLGKEGMEPGEYDEFYGLQERFNKIDESVRGSKARAASTRKERRDRIANFRREQREKRKREASAKAETGDVAARYQRMVRSGIKPGEAMKIIEMENRNALASQDSNLKQSMMEAEIKEAEKERVARDALADKKINAEEKAATVDRIRLLQNELYDPNISDEKRAAISREIQSLSSGAQSGQLPPPSVTMSPSKSWGTNTRYKQGDETISYKVPTSEEVEAYENENTPYAEKVAFRNKGVEAWKEMTRKGIVAQLGLTPESDGRTVVEALETVQRGGGFTMEDRYQLRDYFHYMSLFGDGNNNVTDHLARIFASDADRRTAFFSIVDRDTYERLLAKEAGKHDWLPGRRWANGGLVSSYDTEGPIAPRISNEELAERHFQYP